MHARMSVKMLKRCVNCQRGYAVPRVRARRIAVMNPSSDTLLSLPQTFYCIRFVCFVSFSLLSLPEQDASPRLSGGALRPDLFNLKR